MSSWTPVEPKVLSVIGAVMDKVKKKLVNIECHFLILEGKITKKPKKGGFSKSKQNYRGEFRHFIDKDIARALVDEAGLKHTIQTPEEAEKELEEPSDWMQSKGITTFAAWEDRDEDAKASTPSSKKKAASKRIGK